MCTYYMRYKLTILKRFVSIFRVEFHAHFFNFLGGVLFEFFLSREKSHGWHDETCFCAISVSHISSHLLGNKGYRNELLSRTLTVCADMIAQDLHTHSMKTIFGNS